MKKPQAILKEAEFNINELFFSTTNERGVIQFGNDVFVRVSGYQRDTLMGAPHSIIRHPDMPRSVFKLFWNTIQANLPIIAYVKNMAADGSYYWVLAFAFPVQGGYLSIRIKPSSELFEATKKIYSTVLEKEKEVGMDESLLFLEQQIRKAGFKDYTDFMIKAAFAELNNLEKHKEDIKKSGLQGTAAEISELSNISSAKLKECFVKIQGFQKSNATFVSTVGDLSAAFLKLKYISLNMNISAAKFQETGASLGVVAKEFSKLAEQIQAHLASLTDFVSVVSAGVEKSALGAVALDSQMSMVDFFIRESILKMQTSDNAFEDMLKNKGNFSTLFKNGTKDLATEIASLEKSMGVVLDRMADVRKLTAGLSVIKQMGAVESARDSQVRQTFTHYLEEMQKFIDLLQVTTQGTQKEMQDMKVHCHQICNTVSNLSGGVDAIFEMASYGM
jgi:aerotaxis receptor